jgi:hypothetical protein
MRRLKNPNQWPPGGWNFEEPSTGFRFRGSLLHCFTASLLHCFIRDASALFTREFNSKGNLSPEQIANAYEHANGATR